jgi:hypothetical protein
VTESQARDPIVKSRNYDMEDSDEDLERWRSLDLLLRDCAVTVVEAYRKADLTSHSYQIKRRLVVSVAAVCGMLAVLFAITQLTIFQLPGSVRWSLYWVRAAEILAVIAALIAVVVFGLRAALPTKWLLERERAERYRRLKFYFLIHPEIWGDAAPEARRGWLRAQIARVESLDKEGLENWAKGVGSSEADPPEVPAGVESETLTQLLDYYKEKRLCWQRDYFDYQARRRHFWESLTRHAPALFFFLSILAAMAHFLWELQLPELHGMLTGMGVEGAPHAAARGETTSPAHEGAGIALIMLAACLPVIGAAIRTVRTAHEFGRNTLRFEAASNELKQLSRKLQDGTDPRVQLEVCQGIENVLEEERREWMRLMIEAEWYG